MSSDADGTAQRRDDKDIVRFERRISHPIDRVWAAITSPEELRGWLGDADVDLREGGRFRLRWLNPDADGNVAEMHATITALDPPYVLETEGDIHGVLRWELEADGDATILTFTSTLDLPDEYRFRVLAGWHFHMNALADALAGRPFDWSLWNTADWEEILRRYLVRALFDAFMARWNARSSAGIAALFAADGNIVGFDGSTINGQASIESHLGQIFADHQPARYVGLAREIRLLSDDVALLRAVVGMIPPHQHDLKPELNAIQTLVAQRQGDEWRITMLQATPARFDGRPGEAGRLTTELGEVLQRQR